MGLILILNNVYIHMQGSTNPFICLSVTGEKLMQISGKVFESFV
jgi:hypothetical protein